MNCNMMNHDLPEDLTRTRIYRLLNRMTELEEQVLRQADIIENDELTGIKNERGLKRAVDGREGWYLLCDLNGFKAVNDTYGHAAGDAILAEFGKFLRDNTRQDTHRKRDAVACRLHGDEFVVWTTTEAGARRIQGIVLEWRSVGYQVSASAGVGTTLKDADRVMYLDKRRRAG